MKVSDGTRQGKISSELRRILSEYMLHNSIIDTRRVNPGFISITEVRISSCLRHAKVFAVSLSSDFTNDEAVSFLNRHSSRIRRHVASKISLKFIPDFQFFIDDSFENASKVDAVLKMIREGRS